MRGEYNAIGEVVYTCSEEAPETNELPNPKQALKMLVFSRDSLQPESPGSATRDNNNTKKAVSGCRKTLVTRNSKII